MKVRDMPNSVICQLRSRCAVGGDKGASETLGKTARARHHQSAAAAAAINGRRKRSSNSTTTTTTSTNIIINKMMANNSRSSTTVYLSGLLTLTCTLVILQQQVTSSSASSVFSSSSSSNSGDTSFSDLRLLQQPLQQPLATQHQYNFDASNFKNVYEAIRGHPELREFATLCEADGVKQIVSMDKMPLTVFAPIDRSLSDLLSKAKSRSINLIELAKHHIAQGLIVPDDNSQYPLRFATYSLLSPLYLNQVSGAAQSTGSGQAKQQQQPTFFVNNARILATYLIRIDQDTYQTLHVLDHVLEFAYLNRKTQLRQPSGSSSSSSSSSSILPSMMPSSSSSSSQQLNKRAAFSLDDLFAAPEAAFEFYERFGDLAANQPVVDQFHVQSFKGSSREQQRISLDREQFNFDRLVHAIRQHPSLRGKLFQVNESSALNTYFLPVDSVDLRDLLAGNSHPLEAMVIPDQVLFTRTFSLGSPHSTLFERSPMGGHRLQLSLAKSLPEQVLEPAVALGYVNVDLDDPATLSRRFLSAPLLVQAECRAFPSGNPPEDQLHSGITSAEVLVANIPLTNGVLHLTRKPVVGSETSNVMDYLNDHENQLSNVVNALGSRTCAPPASGANQLPTSSSYRPIKVNRFRELLARERQMLASLTMDANTVNKTILAPSDGAFARLRFDLRALVQGDEALIPGHWDASYRRDLLERLVKRHLVLHQTITTDQMLTGDQHQPQQPASSSSNHNQQILSENGHLLSFSAAGTDGYLVESDNTQAKLVHHDLIGSNGVLHIIDRVLGEEQETVHSLLNAHLIRYKHALEELGQVNSASADLGQLIQSNIQRLTSQQQQQQQQQDSISSHNSLTPSEQQQVVSGAGAVNAKQQSPELQAVSKAIGQYLDELASTNARQMELLANSVNISFQLAKLTSQVEGLEDWNDKFKQVDRMFTYFVPSDLAWIRLQQSQPELYKPLMYFLEQKQVVNSAAAAATAEQQVASDTAGATLSTTSENSLFTNDAQHSSSSNKLPRSSESSHRLRQILERHLVANRKIGRKELNLMESLQTVGATLRLTDLQPLTDEANSLAPAALHSIVSNGGGSGSGGKLKALKLENTLANIVQVDEASNGYVYVIDNVLLLASDPDYLVLTSASPAVSSSMSSLLGAHNSAILDFIHSLLAPAPFNLSAQSVLALLATLTLAIVLLLVVALVLIVRRHRQNKLNRHQQLESGLTSSSSANSGSTSTTKSL